MAPLPVSLRTDFEYQPMRVLMSVLLTPAAATRMSTSPGAGFGTGTSSRSTSRSKPPCPVSSTARIVAGITGSVIFLFLVSGALAPGGKR